MLNYEYDQELKALCFTVRGRFELQEFRDLMDRLLKSDYKRLETHFLWDAREVLVEHISTSEVFATAQLSKPVLDSHGSDWKSAIVVSSPTVYGLIRMVDSFISPQGDAQIRIFHSMDEARTWLLQHPRGAEPRVL